MLPRCRTFCTLPWRRNFSMLPRHRNHYSAWYRTTNQHNLLHFHDARSVRRCRNFSTLLRHRNDCGARYLTTDLHNCPCLYGIGSFLHYHGVGTSHFLFQESLEYLIPNNRFAQSSMLPWYRNFSTSTQSRNHYGARYLTIDKHNLLCFHGVGSFPHFRVVGTSTRFHSVGIIMVLDTQQWISTIFYASMVRTRSYFRCVGTSPRFHGVGIIMVVDTQQQISTIVHDSTV